MRLFAGERLKPVFFLLLLAVLVLGLPQQNVRAQETNEPQVTIYFFWGETCPHCAAAKPFLEDLIQRYPQVELKSYEVYNSEENRALFHQMAADYGVEAGGVPTFFIGDQVLVGYNEARGQEIEAIVKSQLEQTQVPVETSPASKVAIHFFWSDTCPHCAEAKPFLEDLIQRYPEVELGSYEVNNSQENRDLFQQMADEHGVVAGNVPTFFIGDQVLIGFPPGRDKEIEAIVQAQLGQNEGPVEVDPDVINLPIVGAVDLSSQSLVLSTALIAFVDGFNPCSLWVLSMLMALVIHTGSRKKIVLIGVIFLTVTAAIYAIFIAGLFSVLQVVSFMGWIQFAVAALALVFAVINIKDYFFYKEGVSLTIADEKKGGIYRNIRRIINAESLWGLITATVAMAAGVSLVEFSCTAGFPVLWTNLLTAQGVGVSTFVLLLLLYLVIYQIDELVIFFTVVFTLKASKMEEKHGRILKLIGGSLMLTLAVVMLINPGLMSEISTSLLIFVVAFGLALLVLLVHRTILPKFGVWIGTETPRGKPARTVRRYKRH